MNEDQLLTPDEVAQRLQVDVKTVYRWIKRGELEAIRLSRKAIRISPRDLSRFLDSRRSSTREAKAGNDGISLS